MKRAAGMVALLLLLVFLCGCGSPPGRLPGNPLDGSPAAPTPGDGPAQAPSVMMEYETLADLEGAMGFSMPVNQHWMDAYLPYFSSVAGRIAQIDFNDQGEHVLTYRMAQTDSFEDISGDYNAYADLAEVEINGAPVSIRGNDGSDHLATWHDGAYSYSVSYTNGIEESDLIASVEGIG